MRQYIWAVLFAAFGIVRVALAQQWEWQNPDPQANNLNAVDFVNADSGWAVGLAGTILRTRDGGQTWEWQYSSGLEDFYDVKFVDPWQGWVVGGYST